MMKKACILLVCLALLVACLPPLTVGADAAVAEGTCGDGVHWTLSDGGTLTLSGTGPMTDYSYPVKPSNYSTKLDISKCIIEPCGVDTQVTNQNEVRHMSARYMLTGKDADGVDCHIYVENNAWFTNGEQPKPFRTVPTFITDSRLLAPYLHRNQFVGEGLRDERGLWIRFYEVTE